MAPKAKEVFVVWSLDLIDEVKFVEVCTKQETADAVAERLRNEGAQSIKISKVELDASAEKKKAAKGKATKKDDKKSEDKIANSEDDAAEDDTAPASTSTKPKRTPKKKSPKAEDDGEEKEDRSAARRVVPEGVPGALAGLKFMFTGTMELDRGTMQTTAGRYGGIIEKKLENVDYVVLGTKPGAKKLEGIKKAGIPTMTEQEFMDRIKGEDGSSSEPPKKKVKT